MSGDDQSQYDWTACCDAQNCFEDGASLDLRTWARAQYLHFVQMVATSIVVKQLRP
jgi:hypothetical protein